MQSVAIKEVYTGRRVICDNMLSLQKSNSTVNVLATFMVISTALNAITSLAIKGMYASIHTQKTAVQTNR
jgi:hypothetical protein